MRKIVEIAVARKVTVVMITIAILVFGVISLNRLKTNLLPELSYPTVTIKTEYLQAAPSEVESLITKPLEEAISIIKNIRRINSVSKTGVSEIMLEFNWGTNIDLAIMDIREKIDAVDLPYKSKRPVILRFDPSLEPIIRLGLVVEDETHINSDGFSETLNRLRIIAQETIKRKIDAVSGVAAVKVSGGLESEIQIQVDQRKLAKFNLTMQTVNAIIADENVDTSGGNLKEGPHQFILKAVNRLKNIEDIKNIIVSSHNNAPVYLRDVATVHRGFKKQKSIIRLNGSEAVEIAIFKEGDANVVSVAELVIEEIEKINSTLPKNVDLKILRNQAIFIQNAVNDVMVSGIVGGILAVIILYTFLKNIWATIIISFSIPVSVIATFNLMYGNSITLNIMSLGGITLGIGMLLDNSIVVLENIHRHLEKGVSVILAATNGAGEVISAVTASTLTTIAVFFPMVFVEGIAGQLFKDQALTITFSLIMSLVVALTLIPMLAALGDWKKEQKVEVKEKKRSLSKKVLFSPLYLMIALLKTLAWLVKPVTFIIQFIYGKIESWYLPVLKGSLRFKFIVLGLAVGLFSYTLLILPKLGVELMPSLAQNELGVFIQLPAGTVMDKTDEVITMVQKKLEDIPEIKSAFSISGGGRRLASGNGKKGDNVGQVMLTLSNNSERTESEIVSIISKRLKTIPGIQYKVQKPALFSLRTPLEIEVTGHNLEALKKVSKELYANMIEDHRFKNIKSSIGEGHPELEIHFDNEKLASLGFQSREIADRIMRKIQGEVPSKLSQKEQKIDIRVNIDLKERNSTEDIKNLIINPESTYPITLDAVSKIMESVSPDEIKRIDQSRVAIISAGYGEGDMGDAVAAVNRLLEGMELPPGVAVSISGQNEEMNRSFDSLKMALLLAVFLVYLVMASQFESFIHPLVILFSIPLSLIGAVFALYFTDSKISVVVFIGAILLAGIVVNNAIVLIDKINQLRADNVGKIEAILEAGRLRLRPILMTTLTTTLGLIPMALGIGEGAEIRSPMAVTVIGGLLGSTLLTLIIIPTIYSMVDTKN